MKRSIIVIGVVARRRRRPARTTSTAADASANAAGGGQAGAQGRGGQPGGGGGFRWRRVRRRSAVAGLAGRALPMTVEMAAVKRADMSTEVTVVGNLIGRATVEAGPKVSRAAGIRSRFAWAIA